MLTCWAPLTMFLLLSMPSAPILSRPLTRTSSHLLCSSSPSPHLSPRSHYSLTHVLRALVFLLLASDPSSPARSVSDSNASSTRRTFQRKPKTRALKHQSPSSTHESSATADSSEDSASAEGKDRKKRRKNSNEAKTSTRTRSRSLDEGKKNQKKAGSKIPSSADAIRPHDSPRTAHTTERHQRPKKSHSHAAKRGHAETPFDRSQKDEKKEKLREKRDNEKEKEEKNSEIKENEKESGTDE